MTKACGTLPSQPAHLAASNMESKPQVPLCSKGCTDSNMTELLCSSPARWSPSSRRRATTVLLEHAAGRHDARLAKPTLAKRVRRSAVRALRAARSRRMNSYCICMYLTALSAMLTCATCAEAFNYLLALPLWRVHAFVERRCELHYEHFVGLLQCNHSEQKYMHKARFPCIQVNAIDRPVTSIFVSVVRIHYCNLRMFSTINSSENHLLICDVFTQLLK